MRDCEARRLRWLPLVAGWLAGCNISEMCLGVCPCAAPILNSSRHCICPPGNPSAPRVFPVSIGNLVGPPNFDSGPPLLQPPALSPPRLLQLFLSPSLPPVTAFSLSLSRRSLVSPTPIHRSFRTNERSTGGARAPPPCFSRYEIRSTVVRHAKDAPMKQMRVMVRKPGTLYRANARIRGAPGFMLLS